LEIEYDKLMSPTIQEFLRRKGAVGFLSVLNERGKTYSEIESEVEITTDTISKRKDEALEIGLVGLEPARHNDRTVNEYHLTDFGEELVQQMALKGIVSNYLDMRTHQEKVEEKNAELIDWIYDNPGYFAGFTEANEETLIDRTGDVESSSPDNPSTNSDSTPDESNTTEPPGTDSEEMDDSDNAESEGGKDAGGDEDNRSQSRLSDPDVQERIKKLAESDTDGEDDGEDAQ
jgi:DNA-binding HxlR family transcriptional regulator